MLPNLKVKPAPGVAKTGLSLERFLPYRLSYSTSLLSEAIARAYQDRFELSIPEWRVIAHVAEDSAVTQQEIGRRARMDKVTVSRAARALCARGLIARASNPRDRRSQILTLTKAGGRLYRSIAPKALELERAVFDQFDPREIALLRRMLAGIDAAAATLIAAGDGRRIAKSGSPTYL
jgi:DNA-binding MarR family transcriptional regulator